MDVEPVPFGMALGAGGLTGRSRAGRHQLVLRGGGRGGDQRDRTGGADRAALAGPRDVAQEAVDLLELVLVEPALGVDGDLDDARDAVLRVHDEELAVVRTEGDVGQGAGRRVHEVLVDREAQDHGVGLVLGDDLDDAVEDAVESDLRVLDQRHHLEVAPGEPADVAREGVDVRLEGVDLVECGVVGAATNGHG